MAEWALLIGLSPAMERELVEYNTPKCRSTTEIQVILGKRDVRS